MLLLPRDSRRSSCSDIRFSSNDRHCRSPDRPSRRGETKVIAPAADQVQSAQRPLLSVSIFNNSTGSNTTKSPAYPMQSPTSSACTSDLWIEPPRLCRSSASEPLPGLRSHHSQHDTPPEVWAEAKLCSSTSEPLPSLSCQHSLLDTTGNSPPKFFTKDELRESHVDSASRSDTGRNSGSGTSRLSLMVLAAALQPRFGVSDKPLRSSSI